MISKQLNKTGTIKNVKYFEQMLKKVEEKIRRNKTKGIGMKSNSTNMNTTKT